ncbi:MAG: HD domain-containing phosphohydrolase, partial [Planctomycetota bacterium]
HDIGKVGIPDQVLLKPGSFTEEERTIMESHPRIGGECLEAISDQLGQDDFLQLSREIAFCHHEKWDGTGYPAGLSADEIPMSARIVALADVYDALRSRRPYKERMPHEEASRILQAGSGCHFDPDIVEAFLACEATFREISEQPDGGVDWTKNKEPALVPA